MTQTTTDRLLGLLPRAVQGTVERAIDNLEVFQHIRDPRVMRSLAPSGLRGLVFLRGKQGEPSQMPARHSAHFDWTYPHDQPEMADLYRLAKQGQWDGDRDLPWETDVDPMNPEVQILDSAFFDYGVLEEQGVRLTDQEQQRLGYDFASWMLSQFLHGEQGALFAAAQVTESVQFFDGKLYGATQVMDEARHVEVFHRYLDTKMGKLYHVNDNLFVIIDALMTDSRWDMKFLGMQIMVEGLALGAFGNLYQQTNEPLLKSLLKQVIMDEARHVHYGVVALRDHVRTELSESERREREDWAFEIAMLMRNRFMAFEVYEEWFEHRMSRSQWKTVINQQPGMENFRHVMFSRLMPNLREIGLLTERIRPHYRRAGLAQYFDGVASCDEDGASMIANLDQGVAI